MSKKVLIIILAIFIITIMISYFMIKIADSKISLKYEINPTIPAEVKFYVKNKGVEVVEFNDNYYVFIKLGTHSTGGYSIKIEKIETSGRNARIYVKTESPRIGEAVTMAFTYPYATVMFNERPNIKVLYNK